MTVSAWEKDMRHRSTATQIALAAVFDETSIATSKFGASSLSFGDASLNFGDVYRAWLVSEENRFEELLSAVLRNNIGSN
jgi:hypothetical protein